MTSDRALTKALEAKKRHHEYGDGVEYLNRRNLSTKAPVFDDSTLLQMADAIASCSFDLTRSGAISHILQRTFTAR
jgi:hypothetical protein